MQGIRVLAATAVVLMIGACGSTEESADSEISVGGEAITVADGNLEITITAVRDRGDMVTTDGGTLSVDAAKRDTHTIFEFPFTASVISGDQWGLAFEALVISAADVDVETALVCGDSFCGGATSSFGVFAGSDRGFTLYAVAPSDVDSFTVGFTGASQWPPAGAGESQVPEVPIEVPEAPAVEVNP